MKQLTQIVVILAFSMPVSLRADTLTLTPSADSTVDALDPNTIMNVGNLEAAMTGANNDPATDLTFFYAQFQMPDGTTGQNIQSINSIDLQLTRSASAPALSLTYYVYGVFEGFDAESADTYTWNDGVGFDPANNEVRFPSDDEISYYSDPAESGFVGFIDTASEGPPLRPFGFFPTQSATAVQNLQDLILDDTDGRITFYVKVRPNFGVTTLQTFASMEHPTNAAPTLIIDFVPGSQSVLGDYDGDGDVDAEDLTVWRNGFGQTGPDLPADGDADDDVDGHDFLIWQQNLTGPGGVTAVTTIPEPAGCAIALAALLGVGVLRRNAKIRKVAMYHDAA
ncbi:MAG: hypothetical protein H0T51_19000 [Pirellulales bacterium]|nr:hypothetical protein [Pirellulales bacterium]